MISYLSLPTSTPLTSILEQKKSRSENSTVPTVTPKTTVNPISYDTVPLITAPPDPSKSLNAAPQTQTGILGSAPPISTLPPQNPGYVVVSSYHAASKTTSAPPLPEKQTLPTQPASWTSKVKPSVDKSLKRLSVMSLSLSLALRG